MNELIMYECELEVRVRKYQVDIVGLQECLRKAKKSKNITNKQISEELDIPLTQVEHYFRTDIYFAIPDPDIWLDLKKLLGIDTNIFDESIMTFVVQGGGIRKI